MSIRTVIVPAAGLGTRFLPITKSIPKEMLPLLNKPALQYIVTEGLNSGIDHFCIITSETKQAIKHYFSPDKKLHDQLSATNKLNYLAEIDEIIQRARFSYPLQPEMRGLGDAILMGKSYIKENQFAVILPDDIMIGKTPAIKQLIEIAQREQATVIGVMEVPVEEISAYGSIKIKRTISQELLEIEDIIEKPKPHEAFSNLAIAGRYVFSSAIFDALEKTKPASNGEIQLTDAIVTLIHAGHKVLAYKMEGRRFDLGRPQGWLEANNYINNL